MKAAIREKYGSPDVLSIREVDIPTPKEKEVLVKVYCTTVNRTDEGVLTGKPYVFRLFIGLFGPKRKITGTDFAGQVMAVGEKVQDLKIGDRVFGLNDEGLSSHAEYLCIREDKAIAKIPDQVSYTIAAASAEGPHYALNFLNKVKINKGTKILVNGATGGIGSAATQLLVQHGMRVTAVCDTKNYDLIKSLGVDKVIDYRKEDFTQLGDKYNLVLDAVGKSRFKYCKPILKDGGQYISSELGPRAENIFLTILTKFGFNKRVLFPIPVNPRKSIQHMAKLLNDATYNPLIDRIYPLDNIHEAFKYVMTGMKTGNVVLRIIEE